MFVIELNYCIKSGFGCFLFEILFDNFGSFCSLVIVGLIDRYFDGVVVNCCDRGNFIEGFVSLKVDVNDMCCIYVYDDDCVLVKVYMV